MRRARVLVLDFDRMSALGSSLQVILESLPNPLAHFQVECVRICESALSEADIPGVLSVQNPDMVFIVLHSDLLEYISLTVRHIKAEMRELPVLVIAEEGETEDMLELLRLGVDDFVISPLRAIDIIPRVSRLLEQACHEDVLTQKLKEELGLRHLVGESPAFISEIKKIPMVARCNAGVLISGETGTGKELCARAIHYLSPRTSKPFIPVNCGAIPSELVENELFGHERGAYTGASASQSGLVREADGGTIFLDEVDCLPLLAQVKLLRFLQVKEYRPLGSTKMRKADVRVIAATNIDLEEAVRVGRFRNDLYYRLNVIQLIMPTLRERQEDIPLLVHHFLAKYAKEFSKSVTGISLDVIQKFMSYDWPGNVRELEHVIKRAVILSEQSVIRSADVILPGSNAVAPQESFQEAKSRVVSQFERNYIQGLLLAYGGNIARAAQAARKERRTFWQLIRKHRIDVQSFKSGNP
ncbi:MAG TPA: sigma-54 dependent transcriptional regulator [Thermodesulfobacteriota bacterium]|nr:sigma-54 dependent transcriptional regulator [Thermodesulfobacteriota bacterium]